MYGIQVTQGSLVPVPALALTDISGAPINLAGAVSLQFQMMDAATGDQITLAAATKIQTDSDTTTWGQIAYYWTPPDVATPGLYKGYFVVDFGNGSLKYPVNQDFYILIKTIGGLP